MKYHSDKYRFSDWDDGGYVDEYVESTLTPKQQRMLQEILDIGNKELLSTHTKLVEAVCHECGDVKKVRVNIGYSPPPYFVCPRHSSFGGASGFYYYPAEHFIHEMWSREVNSEFKRWTRPLGIIHEDLS